MWMFVPRQSCRSVPDTAVSSEPSLLLAPEFGLWVLLSGKPMRLQSSQVEWKRMPWIRVLSGTIWNPSMAAQSAALWISSLRDSLARGQALLASGSALTTNGGSGRRSGGSRSTPARAGSSSRTSPACSPLTAAPRSRGSSGIWRRAGGLRSGIAFPREPSVPRTSEIVSSCSLPTPSASQYGSSQNGINGVGGAKERPSAGRLSLVSAARAGLLPTLHESAAQLEIESSPSDASTGMEAGRLSPSFVEWMMGVPTGWTRIPMPISSTSSVTASSPKRRASLSASCGRDLSAQLSLIPDKP